MSPTIKITSPKMKPAMIERFLRIGVGSLVFKLRKWGLYEIIYSINIEIILQTQVTDNLKNKPFDS